eukprot:TRINITY_DN7095_c0_g1_i7.p1 TRINITY_DN7095_c0_g1~~TRINITY_DN7095_c0_g1_i7.p1  ORF type:complete len:1131 (-),score=244.37 TRINITY_DN7095_c0_g1_i7:273-3665(-)
MKTKFSQMILDKLSQSMMNNQQNNVSQIKNLRNSIMYNNYYFKKWQKNWKLWKLKTNRQKQNLKRQKNKIEMMVFLLKHLKNKVRKNPTIMVYFITIKYMVLEKNILIDGIGQKPGIITQILVLKYSLEEKKVLMVYIQGQQEIEKNNLKNLLKKEDIQNETIHFNKQFIFPINPNKKQIYIYIYINKNINKQRRKKMTEANPKLLSLLDKLQHPIDKIKVEISIAGVYGFPEEWKTVDDANQGLFTYQAKFLGLEVKDGKIIPRQLTEKELKEQEELANAKLKKASKKQDKQPENEKSPEELEAIKLKEKEEEEKALEEWNKLDKQTQIFRTYEDKYKSPSLQFENKAASVDKEGQELVVIEERVFDDKGEWLYFTKGPTSTEEEIAKMKKTKPKNLNLLDLNLVTMRTWVELEEFTNPGISEITKRCYLQQQEEDLNNPDVPKPNLANTYVMVTIKLTPPIQPLVTEIQPKMSDLIQGPPPIPKLSSAKECIVEFKNELQLAMESLAIEYSQMFSKELNGQQDSKPKTTITQQKKQEIQKRKEQFLYDFNVSGKYKILKERLKKSIVKICRDKFQKQGSITGITTDQKDQFYSDLYVFLIEQTRQTLNDLVYQKREELHDDIVTSYDQTLKEREKVLQNITKENDQDRLVRLATEYEILNQMDLVEKNLKNLLSIDERSPKNYYLYTKFLLRISNYPKAEEMLEKAISFDMENQEYLLLLASLYTMRKRFKEACVILKHLTEKQPENQQYNIMLSLLYQVGLNEPKLAEKYKRITERIFLRNNQLIKPKASHKKTPNPFEIPNFKQQSIEEAESHKGPTLTHENWDDVYHQVIDYYIQQNLIELVEKVKEQIFDSTTSRMKLVECNIELFKGNYEKCIEIINKIIESNPKNYDVLQLKANICFLSDKLYEAEDTFLKLLKLKPPKAIQIYLRLGTVYQKRKSWGDAKAIFLKACEIKSNSSLSWLGLGISCLRLNQMKDAEEALTQANIYDPLNGETWGYLALLCLYDNGRFTQANQALRELFKTDVNDSQLLEELGDELMKREQYETSEKLFLKILETNGENKTGLPNYGELNLKLGQVNLNQKKYQEALVSFEEALQHLEGENVKNLAKGLAEQARFNIQNAVNEQ